MSQPDNSAELLDDEPIAGGPSVGPEQAPDEDYDTGPRPEDGPQDVDQEPHYEDVETDDSDDVDDPEVHEVA